MWIRPPGVGGRLSGDGATLPPGAWEPPVGRHPIGIASYLDGRGAIYKIQNTSMLPIHLPLNLTAVKVMSSPIESDLLPNRFSTGP